MQQRGCKVVATVERGERKVVDMATVANMVAVVSGPELTVIRFRGTLEEARTFLKEQGKEGWKLRQIVSVEEVYVQNLDARRSFWELGEEVN